MKLLGAFSEKVKEMKLFMVILFLAVTMCNVSVPYYTAARNQVITAADRFQSLCAQIPYGEIVRSGKLAIHEKLMESDGEYSVAVLAEETDFETDNYINLKETEMDFCLSENPVTLKYKDSENITREELEGAIGASIWNLSTVNLLGSVVMGIVQFLLLLCAYLMISWFLLKKQTKYRVLIRYTSLSLAAASFVSGLVSLTVTDKLTIILACFTFLSAVMNMLLILPDYNRIKAEEYL